MVQLGRPAGTGGRVLICRLCQDKAAKGIDYKEPAQLRKFINDQGKILPRRVTGSCADHQRLITLAIKRSRELGLLSES